MHLLFVWQGFRFTIYWNTSWRQYSQRGRLFSCRILWMWETACFIILDIFVLYFWYSHLRLVFACKPDRIWRDEAVYKHFTSSGYRNTGLDACGGVLRLGTALNVVLCLENAQKVAIPGLKTPFCIVHGTKDYAVPIEGSKFMFEHASTPDDDKELHCMDGSYHDLLGDPRAQEAMTCLTNFIERRMKK